MAKGTRVLSITRAPEKGRWLLALECGHEQSVMSATSKGPHPKHFFCRTCDDVLRTDDNERVKQLANGAKYEVVAIVNGHTFVNAFNLVACRDCGIVRNPKGNKECRGRVAVGPKTGRDTRRTAQSNPIGSENCIYRDGYCLCRERCEAKGRPPIK